MSEVVRIAGQVKIFSIENEKPRRQEAGRQRASCDRFEKPTSVAPMKFTNPTGAKVSSKNAPTNYRPTECVLTKGNCYGIRIRMPEHAKCIQLQPIVVSTRPNGPQEVRSPQLYRVTPTSRTTPPPPATWGDSRYGNFIDPERDITVEVVDDCGQTKVESGWNIPNDKFSV
ncbi:unnamed protein product [Mesocestoides corti]|nr:unnamed protein product [Mesocestoides corti]